MLGGFVEIRSHFVLGGEMREEEERRHLMKRGRRGLAGVGGLERGCFPGEGVNSFST